MERIPKLPDGQLKVMFHRIRPVMRFEEIDRVLRPSPSGELYFLLVDDPNKLLDRYPVAGSRAANLAEFRRITTLHCWAENTPEVHPTAVEVLAQIPLDIVSQVIAYEVVLEVGLGNIDGNYIRTETILYRKIRRQTHN